MTINWSPETRRMVVDMSKVEAWALLELLNCLVVLDKKPIVKEYKRAFSAMQKKDARKTDKSKESISDRVDKYNSKIKEIADKMSHGDTFLAEELRSEMFISLLTDKTEEEPTRLNNARQRAREYLSKTLRKASG